MRDFIDFVKDIVIILISGIVENWTEIKVSEKRRDFFKHKGSKRTAILFYGSLLVVALLLIFGIIELVKGKKWGVMLLIGGIGLGLFLRVEWGTVE